MNHKFNKMDSLYHKLSSTTLQKTSNEPKKFRLRFLHYLVAMADMGFIIIRIEKIILKSNFAKLCCESYHKKELFFFIKKAKHDSEYKK